VLWLRLAAGAQRYWDRWIGLFQSDRLSPPRRPTCASAR